MDVVQDHERFGLVHPIKSIRLKKLPLEANVAAKAMNKSLLEKKMGDRTQYRASIVFVFDSNEATVTYRLYTNPVFIKPPNCYLGPRDMHFMHMREPAFFQRDIWTVGQLKNHMPEDMDDDPMAINASAKSAEVLARAWCSERSKNVVICRADSPCYLCAVRAASNFGLGIGV